MNSSDYPFAPSANGVIKPKVPIKITNPVNGNSMHANALLDTGADCCTIPSMITRTIGLRYTDEFKSKGGTTGISGHEIDTWTAIVVVELLDKTRQNVLKTMNVRMSYLEANDIPAIVGTSHFLQYFSVTLDYKSGGITLSW